MKAIGMTCLIRSYYNHIWNLLATISTSPTKSCSKSRSCRKWWKHSHHSRLSVEHCCCRTKSRCFSLRQIDHYLELAQIKIISFSLTWKFYLIQTHCVLCSLLLGHFFTRKNRIKTLSLYRESTSPDRRPSLC